LPTNPEQAKVSVVSKLKIAVIGAGYWGKNLVRVLHEMEVLACICDPDPKSISLFQAKYPDVPITSSLADIWSNQDLDAVCIATPAHTHFEIASAALHADLDVFVEKPLATELSEGRKLTDLAASKNKILMVGHILEFHPAIEALKIIVANGELGKINYIYSNRLNFGKLRNEENILWSFAPHDISVMLSLLGEMPTAVTALGGEYLSAGVADVTVSSFEFASTVRGHVFVNWLNPYKEQRLVVIGDQAMAVFEDTSENEKLKIYNHVVDWVDRHPVPIKGKYRVVSLEQAEPLHQELEHFTQCIQTRALPRTNAQSGLKVLEVLSACQKSLNNQGVRVSLEKTSTQQHPSTPLQPSTRAPKLDTPLKSGTTATSAVLPKSAPTVLWAKMFLSPTMLSSAMGVKFKIMFPCIKGSISKTTHSLGRLLFLPTSKHLVQITPVKVSTLKPFSEEVHLWAPMQRWSAALKLVRML